MNHVVRIAHRHHKTAEDLSHYISSEVEPPPHRSQYCLPGKLDWTSRVSGGAVHVLF